MLWRVLGGVAAYILMAGFLSLMVTGPSVLNSGTRFADDATRSPLGIVMLAAAAVLGVLVAPARIRPAGAEPVSDNRSLGLSLVIVLLLGAVPVLRTRDASCPDTANPPMILPADVDPIDTAKAVPRTASHDYEVSFGGDYKPDGFVVETKVRVRSDGVVHEEEWPTQMNQPIRRYGSSIVVQVRKNGHGKLTVTLRRDGEVIHENSSSQRMDWITVADY